MAFNIGGFAQGASEGLRNGIALGQAIKRGQREDTEYEWKKEDREQQKAYQAERKALIEDHPVFQFYRDEQKRQEADNNPVTRGLTAPMKDAANPGQNNIVDVIQAGESGESPNPPLASAVNPSPAGVVTGLKPLPGPTKPPREVPGLNDYLDLGIRSTMLDLKYGKGDGTGLLTLLNTRNKMEREGVTEALLKMNTGDIEGGMSHFNNVGKYRGAQVVDFKQGTYDIGNGAALPTYLVRVRDKNGNISTINTALSLYQTREADKVIQRAMEMRKQSETERHNRATEANAARGMDIKENAAAVKASVVKPVKAPTRTMVLDVTDLITSDSELSKLSEPERKALAYNTAARAQTLIAEQPGIDASEAMGMALDEEVKNITPGEQRSRLGIDWLAKDKPPAYVDRRRAPGTSSATPASPAGQPAQPTAAQPVRITGIDDYNQLPSGAVYIDPNGVKKIKR